MSEILKNWIDGEGLPGILAIDGHIHVGSWPQAETFPNVEEGAARALEMMDANGIDLICAVSGGYMWPGTEYQLGNDLLLEFCERMPGRIAPFLLVNPNDTCERVLAELQRCYDAGIRCIKLLNSYQNYLGDGPNLMALYKFADEHKMLVFNHAWSIPEMEKIAPMYPETDFIFGHYGRQQDDVLQKYDNVYANIWGYGDMGWLDRGIAEVGAHKFIMGSDGFLNAISVGVGPVVFAPISEEEKRLIIGLTQARLLDKVGVLPQPIKEKFNI